MLKLLDELLREKQQNLKNYEGIKLEYDAIN